VLATDKVCCPIAVGPVMLRMGSIVMGAFDIERGVAFWAETLGYSVRRFDGEDNFIILIPPNGEGTRVAMQTTTTPPQEQSRVHMDLIVDSSEEQTAEVVRLVDLGASRPPWQYPDSPDFVVLADPEGNHFCIVNSNHDA
jgi:predicted enzyme related to lactoylglutathione lyase